MTVPLTGSGSLGVRLGHILGGWLDVNAILGGTATARTLSGASWFTRLATITTDYQNGTSSQKTIDTATNGLTSMFNGWQGSQTGLANTLQKLLQQTVIDMVATDQAQPATDFATALAYLIQQMQNGSSSFNASAPSVAAQSAVGTPTGNPQIVSSTVAGSGRTLQYVYPETIQFTCSADSQTGGATAGQETFTVKGQAAASSVYQYNWPLGSGYTGSMTAVPGNVNNGGGNLLVNSDFTTFTTSNVPDNWNILVGAAGTDVFNGGSGNAYTTGGGSLQYTGTGSALLDSVVQVFNTASSTNVGSGGTPAKLTPLTVYHMNGWLKVSATPAAGVVEVALVDGTNTIINDGAGNAASFTQSLTASTSTYAAFNGALRTPASLPATIKLRVRLSTAIDSAKSVYFGRLSLTKANQAYAPGGPFYSIHSGSTNLLLADQWNSVVTTTWGTFQREFQRFFNMIGLNLAFPGSGSPTVADSLIL